MTRFDDIPSLIASGGDSHPALTFYEGRELAGELSRGALCERVEAVAGYLWESLGIRRGDRIAVLSPNRLEVPVLMLAVMRLGGVVVPLNPAGPSDDWTYITAHAKARVCFATAASIPKLAIDGFVKPIDELARCSGRAPAPDPDLGHAMAVILYTSGTTGRPKGVVLTQRNLLANAWSMASNMGLSQTVQLAVLPLYHAHALGFGLMTALTTRGHLVFTDRFDPFAWSEIIRAHDVAVTSVVPTLLPPLLQVRTTADRVPSLRTILVSSAPLSVELARDFEHRTKLRLVQGWGLSEYTNFACCMSPDEDPVTRDELMFGFDVPCVGAALPGTEVRIVDAAGNEAVPGTPGELCVRGPSTMMSYLDDPEASRKTIDGDGWLRTGDEGFAVVRAGKPRYFISGRLKEIIIRGGEKHSPIALERIITTAIPELAGRIAVLGFAHAVHGEEIGAYVEAEAASDDIRARLATTLEAMVGEQRPKIVLFGAQSIPRTHTGKVQRRKLQPLFEPHAACRGAMQMFSVEP
jgi:acyl-CoA synthetase (AMP-forming)/AMP-acid ligase II